MALDERLRRELDRAAQPADPSGVYEDLIRRHERRRIRRIVGASGLALLVLAGSAAGFLVLAKVFDRGTGRPADPQPSLSAFPPFPSNGGILFQRATDGEGQHLWLANADGSETRQVTFGNVIDSWAAWSPNGSTVAFYRATLEQRRSESGLAFLNVTSGELTISAAPAFTAARPDWSPDGARIVFAGVRGETPQSGIYVMNLDGTALEQVTDERFTAPDNPEWSPDGSTIAFSGNLDDDPFSWDVYTMAPDGSGLRNITNTPDGALSELVIGWLPDGNLLVRQSPGAVTSGPGQSLFPQPDRWIEMTPEGDVVQTVYEGYANRDARQEPSISPDGRSVVFFTSSDTDGTFVVSMDLETGAVGLIVEGASPAWQPMPPRATGPSSGTASTVVPDPGQDGNLVDLGLGFPVCDVTSVAGRFTPDAAGTAYVVTGAEDGCPPLGTGEQRLGVDLTDDGTVDIVSEPLECDEWCSAFAAPDIDGDGTDEILVQNIEFSIAGLRLFDLVADLPGADLPSIRPVTVASPGYPGEGLEPGSQPQLWIGGDGFQTETLRCLTSASGRVVIQTSASMDPPDDPQAVWLAHETTFALNPDGTLSIVDVRTFDEPIDGDFSFAQGDGVCGARMPVRFTGG